MNSLSGVSSAPAGALKIPSRIPRARHRTIVNCFRALPAAHIGQRKRRDPGPPGIGKPKQIIHLVTSSSEAMNHPRIKSGRQSSGPDPRTSKMRQFDGAGVVSSDLSPQLHDAALSASCVIGFGGGCWSHAQSFTNYKALTASSTCSACPGTRTLRQMRAMVPVLSIRNVERSMPI